MNTSMANMSGWEVVRLGGGVGVLLSGTMSAVVGKRHVDVASNVEVGKDKIK